jgi:hypothetical protein
VFGSVSIADSNARMQAMKASNPWLEISLNNKSYGVGKQEQMLANLQDMFANNKVPVSADLAKKLRWAMDLTTNALSQIGVNNRSEVSYVAGASQLKQDFKNKAVNAIRELGGAQENWPHKPSDCRGS